MIGWLSIVAALESSMGCDCVDKHYAIGPEMLRP